MSRMARPDLSSPPAASAGPVRPGGGRGAAWRGPRPGAAGGRAGRLARLPAWVPRAASRTAWRASGVSQPRKPARGRELPLPDPTPKRSAVGDPGGARRGLAPVGRYEGDEGDGSGSVSSAVVWARRQSPLSPTLQRLAQTEAEETEPLPG